MLRRSFLGMLCGLVAGIFPRLTAAPTRVLFDCRNGWNPGDKPCRFRFLDPDTMQECLVTYYEIGQNGHRWERLASPDNGDVKPDGCYAVMGSTEDGPPGGHAVVVFVDMTPPYGDVVRIQGTRPLVIISR